MFQHLSQPRIAAPRPDRRRCAVVQTSPPAYHETRGGCWQSRPVRHAAGVSGATMPVDDSPLTRASLLVQLRDGGNHAAWQEFVKLYGPVVYGFPRKRGLQDADAADLMQDVMRSVSAAIARLDYDRNQG